MYGQREMSGRAERFAQASAARTPTIIVVEDEQIVAMDISNALTALGYDVPAVAASGAEALAAAEVHLPDLVLMDIHLDGDLDGTEAAEILRNRFDIPVVFLTAYADDDSVRRAMVSAPFGYLVKPFNRRELRSAVEVALHRHRLETQLRERERWLSAVLGSIGDAIVAMDANEAVSFMNPVAERMTGWTRIEALAMPIDRVLRLAEPDDTPASRQVSPLDLLAGPTTGCDLNLVARGGARTIPVEATVAPILGAGGKREGAVIVLRDISARKEAEEQIRRTQRDFREAIEAMSECISVHRDSKLVYVNPAFVSCLGYDSADEIVGRDVASFAHSDERPTLDEQLHALYMHGVPPPPSERRMVKKNGQTVTLEITATKAVQFEGAPSFIMAARDVTERKRMQSKLLVADRMASVGTLAAGVAHEINNPLTYVMCNIELARRAVDTSNSRVPSETKETLDRALNESLTGVDRVRAIVRELKTFSRADEERPESLHLPHVLDLAINLTANEVRHRAKLVKEYHETPRVRADEARLGQVFVNLLVNAAQAMPEGRAAENEIVVRCGTDSAGRAFVEVRDTGCGIAPDVRARIFDPFFTTKPVGVGTGLGLSICHEIVTSVGGEIEIESEPHRGSTFRVVLPPDLAPIARQDIPEATPLQARHGSVLVIDDEPQIGQVVATSLSSDYEVVAVPNARDALDRIAAGARFDAILCDLMMPTINGMDVYEELLRNAPDQAQRIIFMTGGAFGMQAATFLAEVQNPKIDKPFALGALHEVVRAMVEREADSERPSVPAMHDHHANANA